jgi:hypothetical protein
MDGVGVSLVLFRGFYIYQMWSIGEMLGPGRFILQSKKSVEHVRLRYGARVDR